jgi:lysosomal acid lipase/cholesteryl ester hydrolase
MNPGAIECIDLPVEAIAGGGSTDNELRLPLQRYARNGRVTGEKGSVLLLHGASASSRSFVVPRDGDGEPSAAGGLVGYLLDRGFDVWTLDYRASHLVAAKYARLVRAFTMEQAACQDIPAAIDAIRKEIGDRPLSLLGHCVGSGILAIAIALGKLRDRGITNVVLNTLGLFYRVPWDTWTKADDQVLERLLVVDPGCLFIHPDAVSHRWPGSLEDAFKMWPSALLPSAGPEMFRRLSFMFGNPYMRSIVPAEIDNEDELKRQFGAMPIALYIQCGQSVRRGFAAKLDDTSWSLERRRPVDDRVPRDGVGFLQPEPFRDLHVTMITGDTNRLWHQDSVVLMDEWLKRAGGSGRRVRHILSGYGHQDLLWAHGPEKKAREKVYPLIAEGLPCS